MIELWCVFFSAGDLNVEFHNIYRVTFAFNLTDRDYITDAQLRLKRVPLEAGNIQNSRIDLFMVTRPENYFNEEYFRHITTVFDRVGKMVIFNVSKAIISWLEDNPDCLSGEIKFEIRIRCAQPLPSGVRFVPSVQFFEESNQGLLILTTYKDINHQLEPDTVEAVRHKREDINAGLKFCGETEVRCCLTRFRIDFKRDFNWTWVIKPRDIAFNYCGGECPKLWKLSTEHAAFLDFFRAKQNPTAAPEPCCVPNSYESLSLGLYLNRKLSFEFMEHLVATACACR